MAAQPADISVRECGPTHIRGLIAVDPLLAISACTFGSRPLFHTYDRGLCNVNTEIQKRLGLMRCQRTPNVSMPSYPDTSTSVIRGGAMHHTPNIPTIWPPRGFQRCTRLETQPSQFVRMRWLLGAKEPLPQPTEPCSRSLRGLLLHSL
jgi:hypothetical protein